MFLGLPGLEDDPTMLRMSTSVYQLTRNIIPAYKFDVCLTVHH